MVKNLTRKEKSSTVVKMIFLAKRFLILEILEILEILLLLLFC